MTENLEIKIPDIGGAHNVDVIEILVKPGEEVDENTSLITLESDKASMEIPAPIAGIVDSILLKVGDKVSEGTPILVMKTSSKDKKEAQVLQAEKPPEKPIAEKPPEIIKEQAMTAEEISSSSMVISAGPAVRRIAREFGINLEEVQGHGRKSRILKEDIQAYVKSKLSQPSQGSVVPEIAPIDFSKFGSIEVKPLNKIKRLTGQQVHRSWLNIPHVTQFDEADITDLEAFRKSQADKPSSYKLTILAFVVKAVSKALSAFPSFNASLDASAENLIYKNYVNIGIAVETPNGLVVPVVKQVDQLSVGDIALEMARLSQKAREKNIAPIDMSGGTFTISSLGGIGGTAFTPIVNSPEVAILGLSRASIKPVYEQEEFKPRLLLPLSLSYDHRVIDGAEAARFTRFLIDLLSDIRRIIL